MITRTETLFLAYFGLWITKDVSNKGNCMKTTKRKKLTIRYKTTKHSELEYYIAGLCGKSFAFQKMLWDDYKIIC